MSIVFMGKVRQSDVKFRTPAYVSDVENPKSPNDSAQACAHDKNKVYTATGRFILPNIHTIEPAAYHRLLMIPGYAGTSHPANIFVRAINETLILTGEPKIEIND
jgi:hypothetical protein